MKMLCLLPHLDDEMGVIPLVHYFQKKLTKEIFFYYFSDCKKSCEKLGFSGDILKKENKTVLSKLNIKENNVFYLDYPVRNFFNFRQEILEEIVKLKNNLSPDIVVIPCSKDIHQDHRCIFEEGCRCFKNSATLIGFSYPWNELSN